MLEARRRAPALALSACVVTSSAARAAASALQQPDSRFLGPATSGVKAGYGVAGPRNDSPSWISSGAQRPGFADLAQTITEEASRGREKRKPWPRRQPMARRA